MSTFGMTREAAESFAKQSSKGMAKDHQLFINHINEEIELMQKNYQIRMEQAKNQKEMSDESAKYEFESQKLMLDRASMLNDEYYNMGIKSAKAYFDEKNRLLNENYLNEVNNAMVLYQIQRTYHEKILSDTKEQYDVVQDKISQTMYEMSQGKKDSTVYEALKKKGVDLIKQAEDYKKKEEDITGEMTKQDMMLMRVVEMMYKKLGISKEQLELQRKIKEAQEPYQQRLDILNLEKENLQVMADANELVGNWNALYQNKVDLLKLEGQIRETNINKEIARLNKDIDIAWSNLIKKAPEDWTKEELEIIKHLSKEVELRKELIPLVQKLNAEQVRRAELMRTTEGAIQLASEDTYNKLSNINRNLYDAIMSVTASMENAFMTFFDRTSDGFMNFGKLATSILNEIYKKTLKVLVINPLVGSITSALDGLFGSIGGTSSGGTSSATLEIMGNQAVGGFHSGGLVMHSGGNVPRFHWGGLASDEVPAILQRGEYVVSRRGVAALEAINQGRVSNPDVNVVVKVENQTGVAAQARTKEINTRFDARGMVKEIILELKRTDPTFNAEMARGY